ncbi:MAG: response regulator transcription factor [Bacteroidia bacterium]|nr:response regulator transcription factor [Bacteroidia bacterium]
METESIRLFVVDDHPLITQGIVGLFTNTTDVVVEGVAHTLAEAKEILQERGERFQVALVDIRLQDGMGMELVRYIARHYPHIKSIALTMYDTEEYLRAMIQAGAMGYILKNTTREELLEAMRAVLQGHYYFSQSTQDVIGHYILRQEKNTTRNRGAAPATEGVHLTRRERQILELIAQELTNVQIAEKLGLSPRTVHTHRRSLMQKLGVKNSAGLVRYAIEAGIASPRS